MYQHPPLQARVLRANERHVTSSFGPTVSEGRMTYKLWSSEAWSECQYLTDEEEEELAQFLIEIAKIGYPCTAKEVLTVVQEIINNKGIDAVVTKGWWQGFRKRNPKLTLKSAVPLSYICSCKGW